MKTFTKIIILIVCISLMVGFAGCAATGNNNDNDPIVVENNNNNDPIVVENNDDNEAVIVDNNPGPAIEVPDDYDMSTHFTINYMGRNTTDPGINQYTLVKDALEDRFNITFDFATMSGTNQDMDLAAAANYIPECAWIYLGNTQDAYTLYKDGLTRTIPTEYVQKYAPNYWQAMQDDKSFHPTMLAPGSEDEYFTMYAVRYGMLYLGTGVSYRMDWMDNLGITPKGEITEIVKDNVYINDEAYLLSEFTDLIYDFTFSDPDANGENDTFGYNAFGTAISEYSSTLFSAFNMLGAHTPDENGWAIPNVYSKQNLQALEQLGEWKNLGVLPLNFETNSISNSERDWEAGIVGASNFTIKALSQDYDREEGFWDKEIPLNVLNDNDFAKILLSPPLLNDDGTGGQGRAYEDYIRAPFAGYFYVRKDVSDEKLKRILMFMDYISVNPAGRIFIIFGVQGVNWDWDENSLWSVLPQDDLPDNLKWEAPGYWITPCVSQLPRPEITEYGVRDFVEKLYAPEHWPEVQYTYIDSESAITWDTSDLKWLAKENIRTIGATYKEARSMLINNEGDLDTIWDNMMNTLNNIGFQEYIVSLNENSYLRDELFYEGIKLSPAEKFPK